MYTTNIQTKTCTRGSMAWGGFCEMTENKHKEIVKKLLSLYVADKLNIKELAKGIINVEYNYNNKIRLWELLEDEEICKLNKKWAIEASKDSFCSEKRDK